VSSIEFDIINLHESPPDGWYYKQPESGMEFSHYDYKAWITQIRDHRLANNYPMSADWELELRSNLCKQHPEWGTQVCRRLGARESHRKISFTATLSFLNMLGKWIRDGSPYVEQEEAENRATACASCPNNVPMSFGCGLCMHQVQQAINFLGGKRSTSKDNLLGSCSICSCNLKSAVHFPIESQRGNLTPEMVEEFKAIDYCWKGTSL
jgi:hypothetical protein